MAKLDIRGLNYIVCGTKQNSFNISYAYTDDKHIFTTKPKNLSVVHTNTFFGDVGIEESMHQQYATNKSAFYDINNKIIIHSLYNLNKSKLQDADKKRNTDNKENVEMYVPYISNDFIGAVQFKNYGYALTRELSVSPVLRTIKFDNTPDCQYRYLLSTQPFYTYLYTPLSDYLIRDTIKSQPHLSTYNLIVSSYISANPDLSNHYISSVFDIKRSLNIVDYNYLIEFPNSTLQNTYQNGEIQCNMAVTKNPYNVYYDMDILSNYTIKDSRQYCGIDCCGGMLYLRYRDNVSYNSKETNTYLDSNIKELTLTKSQPADSYSYQHIEVIKSFDRLDGTQAGTGHKSNLFSVRLNDIGLNTANFESRVKAKLRQTITNNIWKIAEKICPANTQLFNVYFEGD